MSYVKVNFKERNNNDSNNNNNDDNNNNNNNSSLWLTCFLVAKMFKAQWDKDRNIDTIMEISVVHGQPLLLYSEN